MLHFQTPVRKLHGGVPVGHGDGGPVRQGFQPLQDLPLRPGIQGGGAFVQQQDGSTPQHRTADGQPLGLSLGKTHAAFPQHRFQALGQLGQEILHAADV